MNVILQAGPGTLSVNLDIAIADKEISFDQLQSLSGQACREERPVVQCAVFSDAPRNDGPRKRLVHGKFNERVGFVIAQQDVVLWLVLLD